MNARISGLLLGPLILASAAQSGTVSRTITFEPPVAAVSGGVVVLSLEGARSIAPAGLPALPVYPAVFVLPRGERVVSVEARPLSETVIDLPAPLASAPEQRVPGTGRTLESAQGTAAFGDAGVPDPGAPGALITEQTASGIGFAWIALHPCRPGGSPSQVIFTPRIEVTIVTAPDGSGAAGPSRAPRAPDLPLGAGDLANPEDLAALLAPADLPSGYISGSPCPYLIVTSAALADAFSELAALKEASGLRTEIVTTEWIDANRPGIDLQERIRSHIRDAWSERGTRFVLLGGDDQVVPHRGMYVKAGTEIEPDIPCDLYYSCLDGNWNADGDQYWGEPGEEDLLPEVSLGRLPVDAPDQVLEFTRKLAAFSLAPPPGRCATALMLGELLWSIDGIDTWGGDGKDEIVSGSSAWGFTTSGIPPRIEVAALYDRDLGSWAAADLLAALSGGVNYVNHLGHSNLHMVMRLSAGDLATLDNGGMPFVCYSQGCYAAAFDNRDDAGAYHEQDAIGELLVTDPGGAAAFIGNTRLGWSAPGTTCGVSQFFDLQFFDAVFGESIGRIGPALDDSRIDNIGFLPYAGIRYVMYGLCLLGDPAMGLWTAEPRELAVSHPASIDAGPVTALVSVSDGGAPVAGALVSLTGRDRGAYYLERTGGSGEARLFIDVDGVDTLRLAVDAPGFLPWASDIPVCIPADEPPRVSFLGVDDSGGDGDGIVENGERIGLDLLVSNHGGTPLASVTVRLAVDDPWVGAAADSARLGDIQPGSAAICAGALAVDIAASTPDAHTAALDIEVSSGAGRWTSRHLLAVHAPGPELVSFSLSDVGSGNGNGCVDAWEFLDVSCSWTNAGSVGLDAPVAVLSCVGGASAKVVRDSCPLPDLPVGSTAVCDGGLQLFVRESTPPFTPIDLVLTLETHGRIVAAETLTVTTCGYLLDDTADGSPCAHEALVGRDGWHVSDEDFVSAPAAWKCGGGPGEPYPNMMEAVLVTPPLCLGGSSTLTLWHRMEAEAATVYPYWAMDAGVAEISADGGASWQILTPAAGYPCRAASSNTIFLPAYQRCWSGTFGWRQDSFDLSAWTGPVMLRLHFASDEQFGFGGWHVDDITVSTQIPTGGDAPPLAPVTRLLAPWPNPFNPAVTIPFETARRGPVELRVYDVGGRLVRALREEPLGPGRHEAVWDGRDGSGAPVASGVYFCRFKAGVYEATGRLVLLR